MAKERFAETGHQSFFGDYIYNQIVPQEHFLRKLKQVIPWERFTKKLIKLYKGGGMYGRPPFEPALLLKMEMVAYLYDLSERQVETYVNDNLSAKYFVGLAVDQKAPDHSTLTKFKERLLERGKLEIFEEMLTEIIQIALENGVQFGSTQIVDSVHSVANVNTSKYESLTIAHSRFIIASAGFIQSGRLATLYGLTRPIRVRLRYGLPLCLSRLRRDGLLRLALDWLHVLREIYMVNSFHFTKSTRLILAHRF